MFSGWVGGGPAAYVPGAARFSSTPAHKHLRAAFSLNLIFGYFLIMYPKMRKFVQYMWSCKVRMRQVARVQEWREEANWTEPGGLDNTIASREHWSGQPNTSMIFTPVIYTSTFKNITENKNVISSHSGTAAAEPDRVWSSHWPAHHDQRSTEVLPSCRSMYI